MQKIRQTFTMANNMASSVLGEMSYFPTNFLRPDKAMLFVMVKACMILQKYSVLCNFQGVYLLILDTEQNEKTLLHHHMNTLDKIEEI